MRRLACRFVVFFLVIPEAGAEVFYVSDFVRVTLRSGPGIDYRVIDMIGTGQKVASLERGQEWTKVRTEGGKEGWILTRHLTTDPPSVLLVETLSQENGRQKEKLADLSATHNKLVEEVRSLKKELDAGRSELSTLKTEHESLKKGATEYLELKARHEKTAAELAEATRRAESYEKDLTRLELHQNIRWFLSGAGVLIVGFIIGFSAKRQKRRTSLL